ncbi:MAG: glycogen/starch/alpha-glucan phosphorylase [Blautia sp.]
MYIHCRRLQILKAGKEGILRNFYNELLNKDWFMTLLDLKDYIKVKDQVFADYEDGAGWAKKMLVNIAQAGFFSSDRPVEQYEKDIWHLK